MLLCPTCQTAYPPGTDRCPRDGGLLRDARSMPPVAAADPLLGRVIADRYEIVERLGVGGMGTVYRARQHGLVRDVALKILKREVSTNPDAVARFQREAKAMSLLAHPNTVRVFDFGQTADGLLYLSMELLEGETLGERFGREPRLPPEEAVAIARQVLASLHEAHSKGLVHRDMKPDNIFLARVEGHEDLVVKVLDFGIAKAWTGEARLDQHETQAGTVFGTPRYMSPEQAQGHPLDPRSDLYSVGILLYQMLCGAPPFEDDDAVVVMAKHIRERPTPVRRRAPEAPIPVTLERIVDKALQKDPALRFQNARAFEEALAGCIPHIERERSRRHPFSPATWLAHLRAAPPPALAAAAGLLVGALGLALLLLTRSEEPTEPPPPRAPAATATTLQPPSAPPDPPGRRVGAAPRTTLRSNPPGAEVWHEGRRIGRTPFVYRLAPGEHMEVELRAEGFLPRVTRLAGGEEDRTIVLAPTPKPVTRRAPRSTSRPRSRPHKPPPKPSTEDQDPYERFE